MNLKIVFSYTGNASHMRSRFLLKMTVVFEYFLVNILELVGDVKSIVSVLIINVLEGNLIALLLILYTIIN